MNIAACLDSLCKQDFPKDLLEIIVADDHSTDNTAAIVNRYIDQGISLLSLEKEMSVADGPGGSKKAALAAGIKKATQRH